jgi:hypothetical protein
VLTPCTNWGWSTVNHTNIKGVWPGFCRLEPIVVFMHSVKNKPNKKCISNSNILQLEPKNWQNLEENKMKILLERHL